MSWSVTISGHDGEGSPENDNLQKVVDAATDAAKELDLIPTTTVVNGTIQGVSIGPVSTDLDAEQDSTPETDNGTESSVELPSVADYKEDWVAYAVSKGMDEDEANDLTKAELVDKYKNSDNS